MRRTALPNAETSPSPVQMASTSVTRTLIWNEATPIVPGIIFRTTSRTVGSFHGEIHRGLKPSLISVGNWNAICTAPAIRTPQASAKTWCGRSFPKCGTSSQTTAIMTRFKATAPSAGMKK